MNFAAEGETSAITGASAPPASPDPSRSLEVLDQVLTDIRRAAAMTEGTFVGIGARLETAINTIDGLTSTFKTLMEELGSSELVQATTDLSQVSARISAFAN